jgi:hypothetical protein
MEDFSVDARANRVVEAFTSVTVMSVAIAVPRVNRVTLYAAYAAVSNKTVLLLNPLKMTSVCPDRENAELRILYKQHILYNLFK